MCLRLFDGKNDCDIRDTVKLLAGARFIDHGYRLFLLNCYTFCYALLAGLGLGLPAGFIEGFNDDAHGFWYGTTLFCLHGLSVAQIWMTRTFGRLQIVMSHLIMK